ncbi:MAG TPA: M23 family metallopeptidase [Terriglobia bacterium]
MSLQKRFYTFLIVAPHGQLRKIQLPHYVVHLALAAGFGALIGLAALANSYARMLLKVSNYDDVRNQREALKTQYQSLENTVTNTNAKLTSLESLASEVALTYGFGRSSRPEFPQALLTLATQSNSTLEASYNASLYAFNLMKTTALDPPPDPVIRALIPAPTYDRAGMPSLWPVHGQITGGFGERMDPLSGEEARHPGIDISAPKGTEVMASADGVVLEAGRHESGYGNEIVIDHGHGVSTKYGHLSEVYVVAGQEVKAGEVIGAVGMTGKSTGPHLHYEVRVGQVPVNPVKFLSN